MDGSGASSVEAASTERWNRLKDLFAAAVEVPPAEREAYASEACGSDPALRAELLALLRAAEIEDGFIEVPAAEALGHAVVDSEQDLTGRRIGPYRIVGLAGRGGLSHVYRAVREGSGYEQQVAIKVLRSGFDRAALLRRFSAERRMLAALSHPNIAHFMDGGATEDGTPYLVMEFVDGLALDEYCDVNGLSLESRIDLVRVLCGAVHYVHQHLMVHGDLKGGNVLVTREGVLKLLDFGIAKLMTPESATGNPATLMLLTPDYASPEQLRGETITTASDVYSLGALLYRILTGAMPYGREPAPAVVIMQRIAAGSITLPHVAAERSGGPHAAFVRALKGDLGTIVRKALKDTPAERYASAQQLADDLHRWLRGYPVEARPDSARYRLRKWVRRNRAAAALSALAVVSLVGGIAATSWQAHIATVERERAERNAARAERTLSALSDMSSAFLAEVYAAIEKIPGSTEARRLLVDNTLKYLQALERDAHDSVRLQENLAVAYDRLALVQGNLYGGSQADVGAANASYRRAFEIRQQIARVDPTLAHRASLLRSQLMLVGALLDSGDAAGARGAANDLGRLAEEVDADPATGRTERRSVGAAFMNLGTLELVSGSAASGVQSLTRAREVYARIARENPDDRGARRDIAVATARLGEIYNKGLGQHEEALRCYREAIGILQSLLRVDPDNAELSLSVRYARATIGQIYNHLGRPREALLELEAVLPEFRRARVADEADQLAPLALGLVLGLAGESRVQLGQYEAALRDLAESEALINSSIAETVPDVQLARGALMAGRARAHLGLSDRIPAPAEREAARRRADIEGKRAVEMLSSLTGSPDTARDAQRHIDVLRSTFGWTG